VMMNFFFLPSQTKQVLTFSPRGRDGFVWGVPLGVACLFPYKLASGFSFGIENPPIFMRDLLCPGPTRHVSSFICIKLLSPLGSIGARRFHSVLLSVGVLFWNFSLGGAARLGRPRGVLPFDFFGNDLFFSPQHAFQEFHPLTQIIQLDFGVPGSRFRNQYLGDPMQAGSASCPYSFYIRSLSAFRLSVGLLHSAFFY